MTLKLILTRHAKSDWGDADLDDHARPLNARGRRSALVIGKWLAEEGHLPEQVLCSTARRTRETYMLAASEWKDAPEPELLDALYHAAPQDMLDILRSRGAASSVMMVAHNPGTSIMARMLAAEAPEDPDFNRYPTCFTTVFEFDQKSWAQVDWGTGKIAATMTPRRLE